MRAKLFILAMVVLPIVSIAGKEKTYNKLAKLYAKDEDKCYTKAKEMARQNTGDVVPYYFITVIHKDRYIHTSTLSGQYSNMSYALFYGAYFDAKANQSLKQKTNWKATKQLLESEALLLIDVLLAANQLEKGKKIAKKLHHLNTKYPELPIQLVPILVDAFSQGDAAAEEDVTKKMVDGGLKLYFGMPQGTEIIPSHSVETEKTMLKIINDARKSKGLKPLVMDEKLCMAARYHAYDMATQNYFDHNTHDRVNGKLQKVGGTFDRIRLFYNDSFVNSENIAAGNENPQETYKQWYNSKGHYKNMFNKESSKVGIGVVYIPNSTFKYYWVFCSAQ
jgi:uncharacterized protein YkwD